jgi:hypothetical protein
MDEYVQKYFRKKNHFYYHRKTVETANEEVFGTALSLDAMPVHPHIVSKVNIIFKLYIFSNRFHV